MILDPIQTRHLDALMSNRSGYGLVFSAACMMMQSWTIQSAWWRLGLKKNRFPKEKIRGCRFGTHAFTHKKHKNMYIYRATWAGRIFRLVLGSFWPLQGALPSEIKPMRNNHIRKLYVYRMIMRPQYITIWASALRDGWKQRRCHRLSFFPQRFIHDLQGPGECPWIPRKS